MYKNKIKNKLQKLGSRAIDIPLVAPPTPQILSGQTEWGTSSRRNKLSLSKDLSITSNTSTEHNDGIKKDYSMKGSKKAYIRKDLLALSNSKICLTAHGGNSEQLQNHPDRQKIKGKMFQDEGQMHSNHINSKGKLDVIGLKDMALNLAKSAAFLNQRIVPVLLQAATLSHQQPHHRDMFEDNVVSMVLGRTTESDRQQEQFSLMQTPINHFKHRTFQQKETDFSVRKNTTIRCETDPDSTSLKKYKNRHKIQHSPVPIKNIKSPTASFCTPKHKHFQQPQTLNYQEETNAEPQIKCQNQPNMHPLGKKLEMINCQRQMVQCRIAKKLDELSNKATSIVKKYAEKELSQSCSKTPKILLSSNRSKGHMKTSSSQKENGNIVEQARNGHPSSKEQNLRNMIMNRIFS